MLRFFFVELFHFSPARIRTFHSCNLKYFALAWNSTIFFTKWHVVRAEWLCSRVQSLQSQIALLVISKVTQFAFVICQSWWGWCRRAKSATRKPEKVWCCQKEAEITAGEPITFKQRPGEWWSDVRCYWRPAWSAEYVFIKQHYSTCPVCENNRWQAENGKTVPEVVCFWWELPEMWIKLIDLHENFSLDSLLSIIEVWMWTSVFLSRLPRMWQTAFLLPAPPDPTRSPDFSLSVLLRPFGLKMKLNLRQVQTFTLKIVDAQNKHSLTHNLKSESMCNVSQFIFIWRRHKVCLLKKELNGLVCCHFNNCWRKLQVEG